MTPILLSNEDLKELYEKKKRLKNREEVHHFADAHEDMISSVAVTCDNRFIISGSSDRSIKIFDLETKQQVHHFENAHQDMVKSVVVTSDNKYFISGSADKSIKVYNLQTRQLFHHFENAHQGSITSMAVTSNNKYIISGSSDQSIKVFDLEARRQVHHFENAHQSEINSVAVTANNKYIVSGSYDKSVKVFDLETRQLVHHFENIHQESISSVAVTSDSQYLISGSHDKSIKVFDLETRQLVHHFENAHQHLITSIAVTLNNKYIISSCEEHSIRVFDLKTKQLVHHYENAHQLGITSVAVTSNNKYIISGSSDWSIKVFDLETPQLVHHFENIHQNVVRSVVVTSDNKYFISCSSDKSIKVYNLETRELIHHFENAHQGSITSVAVTSNNKYIISGSYDNSLKVFDIKTRLQVHHFENAHTNVISSVAVTSDSKYILSCSFDCSIKIHDLETRKLVYHFEDVHKGSITSIAVTSDDRYVVSWSFDKSLKVFDLETKQLVQHFENADQHSMSSVAVTSDKKYVVSGCREGSIKIFDLETRQAVHYFENVHQLGITSLALTSDNKYIISGSDDKSIKVFDLEAQQQVHHFENAHQGSITSVAVTSNNKYIISGSSDKSIKIFYFHTSHEEDLKGLVPSLKQQGADSKKNEKYSILLRDPSLLTQELYFMYGENKQFSIFNSVDNFLFAESVEYSLSEAVRHPELFVVPFRWNILHSVSLYANHEFIAKMPEYSQFKMPFLVDAFDRTPFHYLIAHKNVNLMTVNILFGYICDYLENCQLMDPYEFQKVIKSLSSVLSFIFEKIEIRRRQRFLAIVYTESSFPHSTTAPIFGNILSEAAVFCDSPVLTQKTREKLWDEQGTSQVEFRSNYLNLDYNILSQDMKGLVGSLRAQTNQEIFKTPAISTLIDFLWGQAETPLIIFFVFYSTFIIALSVYLTLKDRCLPYEIVLLVISASFTVNEFWQVYQLRKSYLENYWNGFDVTHLLLTIAFLGTRIADSDNELARAWISTIIVILGYIRWITLLKIFKPTRHLIQVVLTILRDMMSFITVIALIIIAFSIIFLVFNRDAVYGAYLYEAYNVMYGPMDIDEEAEWQFSQKLLMAVLAFFLNVVLLNLLISIMGDSYGQVLEMRYKTDALTRLEMISEAVIYKRFFKANYQTKRGHLVYCLPVGLNEDENEQNGELENIIKNVKNVIQQNNEVKQEQMLMKNEIAMIRNEMSKKMGRLEERIINELAKLKKE